MLARHIGINVASIEGRAMAGTTDAMAGSVPTATGLAQIAAAGRWLLRPAVEPVPGGLAFSATLVRLLVGIMWLYNAAWKVPPDFGQADNSGLSCSPAMP